MSVMIVNYSPWSVQDVVKLHWPFVKNGLEDLISLPVSIPRIAGLKWSATMLEDLRLTFSDPKGSSGMGSLSS